MFYTFPKFHKHISLSFLESQDIIFPHDHADMLNGKALISIIMKHFKNNKKIIAIFFNLGPLMGGHYIFLKQRMKTEMISQGNYHFGITQAIHIYPSDMR